MRREVEQAVVDPFAPDAEKNLSFAQLLDWQKRATAGTADLADAPQFIATVESDHELGRAAAYELEMVSHYASLVLADVLPCTSAGAEECARRHQAAAEALVRAGLVSPELAATYALLPVGAAHAMALAWPGSNVDHDEASLSRLRSAAVGSDTNLALVHQYSMTARLTALALAVRIENGDEVPTEESWAAIDALERALDVLATHRALAPANFVIESEWVSGHNIAAVLLEVFDQSASVFRHYLAELESDLAPSVLSWEQLSLNAFGCLLFYFKSNARSRDPLVAVTRLVDGFAQFGPPSWTSGEDGMPWRQVEMLILMVQMKVGTHTEDRERILEAVVRGLDAEDLHPPGDDDEDLSVIGIVDDHFRDLEQELIEVIGEAIDDDGDLDPDELDLDEHVVVDVIGTFDEIRALLSERKVASPLDEPARLAFWAALRIHVDWPGATFAEAVRCLETVFDGVVDPDDLDEDDKELVIAAVAMTATKQGGGS